MRELLLFFPVVWGLSLPLHPQESDFDTKQRFEKTAASLAESIAVARSTSALDTIKVRIDNLDREYASRRDFLNKALHPATFDGTITQLHHRLDETRQRVSIIQEQAGRILTLEAQLSTLSTGVDSLSTERSRILTELTAAKGRSRILQENLRRLTAAIEAKDQLIFALLDSLFVPNEMIATHTELGIQTMQSRVGKTAIIDRIYTIAAANARLAGSIQLQGKDFSPLIHQYSRFRNRWTGLKERIVLSANIMPYHGGRQGSGRIPDKAEEGATGEDIDSLLVVWNARLQAAFWKNLHAEITERSVPIASFHDGESFIRTIRTYVDSMKAADGDASLFVEEVWKQRIDREWRDPLSHPSMIGKVEYASLDKAVSELGAKRIDLQFLIYLGLIALVAGAGWWFSSRRKKPGEPAQASSAGNMSQS